MHKLESSMKQVEALRAELAGYYCEDESTFQLDDAFKVIRAFCDKLQKAVKVPYPTVRLFLGCELHSIATSVCNKKRI